MQKEHSKLSIACTHIVDEGAFPFLFFESEPLNGLDSGKVYACEKCLKKRLNTKSIDGWKTICEDCVTDLIINFSFKPKRDE